MKFKLVEELLLEKQWYQVEFDVQANPNAPRVTKTGYMYLDDNKISAEHKADSLLQSQMLSTWKEFITKQYWQNIHQYFDGYVPSSVKIISGPLPYATVLAGISVTNPKITDWDRSLRTSAHKDLSTGQFVTALQNSNVNLNDITIHHIDGDEANNSYNNLVIIPQLGNGASFGNAVHQVLHSLSWNTQTGATPNPYVFYTLSIANGTQTPTAVPHNLIIT